MNTHKHILIVDDEKGSRLLLSKTLAKSMADCHVETAENGQEALNKIAAQNFDLVITDLRMPEVDGLELMREIRRSSPRTQLILVTAYGDEDTKNEANLLGVARYINKPVWLKELVEAAQLALQSSYDQNRIDAEAAKGKKVLVVDDSRTTAARLQGVLEQEGLRVILAFDGAAGLQLAQHNYPDLVVLDMDMPGLNGLQVCQALKGTQGTAKIPIIMFTSNSASNTVKQALLAGVDDYIPKDELADMVLVETLRQMGLIKKHN